MSNFRVGQKVVRVNSKGTEANIPPGLLNGRKWSCPQMGEVVTIKTINHWPFGTLLTFYEHDNSHLAGIVCRMEPGFSAAAFRPVVKRKTDISVFTKILTDVGAGRIRELSSTDSEKTS